MSVGGVQQGHVGDTAGGHRAGGIAGAVLARRSEGAAASV
ncbi:hypothetical protein I551_5766 [Mycobacterium ulcerans str. Harvey]|uniref:Uncharacterized protein n=1 Tax=Mycobacterium ulcerans str. Harvey TaxID=1299332 RepID=A0ABP3AA97_MYCUL|nr:hypothetical protein I551_5766 [Mycobacterium ulcerans str. Harvey]